MCPSNEDVPTCPYLDVCGRDINSLMKSSSVPTALPALPISSYAHRRALARARSRSPVGRTRRDGRDIAESKDIFVPRHKPGWDMGRGGSS
jgi:hypothetical protein